MGQQDPDPYPCHFSGHPGGRARFPQGSTIRPAGGPMMAANCCGDAVNGHAVFTPASGDIAAKRGTGGLNSLKRTWGLSMDWTSYSNGMLVVLMLILLGFSSIPSCSALQVRTRSSSSHGIVIDAGSSGTRMRIYQWEESADCTKLPNFVEVVNEKKTPGISSFAGQVEGLGDYMEGLLTLAREAVPERDHSHTPLYVMATAGELLDPDGTDYPMFNRFRLFVLQVPTLVILIRHFFKFIPLHNNLP